MSRDIVGPAPRKPPAALSVGIGVLGVGIAALGLVPGVPLVARIAPLVMGVVLVLAVGLQWRWLSAGRPLQAFVLSDEGISSPLARIGLIRWGDLTGIRIATVAGSRSVVFDVANPEQVIGPRSPLLGRLWRGHVRRGSGVLSIMELRSPIPFETLVAEIDRRYEAAVGHPLPPHPLPDPDPSAGMVAPVRCTTPGRRWKVLLQLAAVSGVALILEVRYVSSPTLGSLFSVFLGFCLIGLLARWHPRFLDRLLNPWGTPQGTSAFRDYGYAGILMAGVSGLALLLKHL